MKREVGSRKEGGQFHMPRHGGETTYIVGEDNTWDSGDDKESGGKDVGLHE